MIHTMTSNDKIRCNYCGEDVNLYGCNNCSEIIETDEIIYCEGKTRGDNKHWHAKCKPEEKQND